MVRIAPPGDMRYTPPTSGPGGPAPGPYEPDEVWEAMRDGLLAAGFSGTVLERIDVAVSELEA